MSLFTCVDRDMGPLFPTLDLDLSLVYKERLQLFLRERVKKARCREESGGGADSSSLYTLFQAPGDPT